MTILKSVKLSKISWIHFIKNPPKGGGIDDKVTISITPPFRQFYKSFMFFIFAVLMNSTS